MVSSIVNLKRILADESSKKSKDMVMTLKVFKKLSSLMLTKADNTTIDVAVRMYRDVVAYRNENREDAVKSKTKMTDFSATKTALKTKQNVEDYKAQIADEEKGQLQHNLPKFVDENAQHAGKKSIDEIVTKISKENRKKSRHAHAILEASQILKKDLTKTIKIMPRFKFTSVLTVHFVKFFQALDKDGSEITEKEHSKSYLNIYRAMVVLTPSDVDHAVNNYISSFDTAYEMINLNGSGWSIDNISHHTTMIYENRNLVGSKWIPTPASIDHAKNGLVNIKNMDDSECLKWCAKYHQTQKGKHDARMTVLKAVNDKYNYDGVNFPAGLEDIQRFEDNNTDLKITIFEYDNEINKIRTFRQSKSNGRDCMFLLRIYNDENEHYVYIRNMSNLFKTSPDHTKLFCDKCLVTYTKQQFITHQCNIVESDDFKTIITYPPIDEVMEMTITKKCKQIKAPFIVTADFESTLIPSDDKTKIHTHKVNSYALQIICSFDSKYNRFLQYRGENPVDHMIAELKEIKSECNRIMHRLRKKYKLPNLSDEEECIFKESKRCHICDSKFTKSSGKVRDHCHYTGIYRGSACNNCNLNYTNVKVSKKGNIKYEDLVIVFHNLRSYDGHFIINCASKHCDNVRVIKQSFEKFMTFSFCGLRFIDSILFMAESLEKLTESLKTENADIYENFHFMKAKFGENAELMIRKGIYPYEYVKNENVFKLEGLPEQKCFYSALRNESVSDEEYAYAQKVYKTMRCKTFGDYHDLYLMCDVLLLADIFENFRKSSISKYKFDPANFLSTPSLAWDCMLDMTGVKLGLIHDDKTRLLFENNKRGGIVQAGGKRLCVANNKYCTNYDDSKKSNFIAYYDANNLYGVSMSDYLPYKLIGNVEKTLDEILKHPIDAKRGYFVEIDVECPVELHEKFKEYPLFAVTRSVGKDELSEYQNSILKLNKTKHNEKSNKLILDLYKKEKYLIHYRYLQKAVELGYVVTKIHQTIEFKQSKWLEPYISKNTAYRQEKGNSKFLKDLYKLLNNAIYGKTNENVLGRSNMELVKDQKLAIKKMSKENFKSGSVLEDMYFIESNANKVVYDRPSYIGNAILDLSKMYMFDFHYNYMKVKYAGKCELIYTDTDSFVYDIETDDLYQDNFNDRDKYFDLSEVKITKFKDEKNAKALGFFKDETNMIPITQFCALAPKSYSFITDKPIKEKINKKVCKGVSRAVLEKEITHDDYEKTLKTGKMIEKINTSIRSFKHQVYTVQTMKTCLSAFDSKMYRDTYNEGTPFGYVKC